MRMNEDLFARSAEDESPEKWADASDTELLDASRAAAREGATVTRAGAAILAELMRRYKERITPVRPQLSRGRFFTETRCGKCGQPCPTGAMIRYCPECGTPAE